MMLQLYVHADAEADLEELWEIDEAAAATIVVTLEEIKADQGLLDALTDHDFGVDREDSVFHVNKWVSMWRSGKDLWRLKVWELETGPNRWRVVYAYFPAEQRYYVLGVVPREFNYDAKHPISKRILAAYEELR